MVLFRNRSIHDVVSKLDLALPSAPIPWCAASGAQVPSLPELWVARAVTYQRKGFRPQTLLTSLADPEAFLTDCPRTRPGPCWAAA
jgi:hypothetical protein